MMHTRRDRDLDAIIEGRVHATNPDLVGVETFFMELRVAGEQDLAPAPNAQIKSLWARGITAPNVAPTPAPVVAHRRQTRTLRRRLAAKPRMRVGAVIAFFATATFSTMAVAGALPGPIQRSVANIGERIGLDLPGRTQPPERPTHHGPTTPPSKRSGAHATSTPTTSSRSTTTTRATTLTTTPTITAPGSLALPTVPSAPGTTPIPSLPKLPVVPALPTVPIP